MANPHPKIPPPGHGRPKGSKNKMNQQIITDIMWAYKKLGGRDFLIKLGTNHRTLFVRLLEKTIPQQIQADISTIEPEDIHIIYENVEPVPPVMPVEPPQIDQVETSKDNG